MKKVVPRNTELLDRIAGQCIAVRVRLINRVVTGIYDEALRPLGIKVTVIEPGPSLLGFVDRELVEDAYDLRSGCGFTDGNGCSSGSNGKSLFGGGRKFRAPTEFLS